MRVRSISLNSSNFCLTMVDLVFKYHFSVSFFSKLHIFVYNCVLFIGVSCYCVTNLTGLLLDTVGKWTFLVDFAVHRRVPISATFV